MPSTFVAAGRLVWAVWIILREPIIGDMVSLARHALTTKEVAERMRPKYVALSPGPGKAGKARWVTLVALMFASLAGCAGVGKQDEVCCAPLDPSQLQLALARAKNLTVLNRVADIPSDGYALLASMLSGDERDSAPLADIGVDWSFGDAHVSGLPRAQHRFSAFNDELLLVVYVVGATDSVRYGALLAPRHSRRYCLFDLGEFSEQYLSVSGIKWQLNPQRHPAAPKAPECVQREVR